MTTLASVIGRGLAADRPTAGTEGRLYYSTDTGVLERDNGSIWDNVEGTTAAPTAHDHTGSGDGGILTNDKHDGYSEYLQISSPSSPPSNSIRVYAKDKSGTATLYYKDEAGTEFELPTIVTGGGGAGSGAPSDATYVTTTANGTLSAEVLLSAVIGRGATGSKPAAGTAGRLYYDTTLSRLERDNGVSWDVVEGTGSSLTVREIDGSPSATFDTIEVTNGKLTDQGGGVARLDLTGTASGAPAGATYVTEDADGTLSAESVLGTTVITQTAYASRQAAAKAGRLHFPTDALAIARDDGAAWKNHGPIWRLTAPVDGNYAWINQGSASVAAGGGAIKLIGTVTSSVSPNLRVKSVTAPYTVTALIIPHYRFLNFHGSGLAYRQSSDGKLVLVSVYMSTSNWVLAVRKFTNPTTFSADYTSFNIAQGTSPIWLRLSDNSTNRVTSWSLDGVNWEQLHSVGRTDFLTADQAGFFVDSQNASAAAAMTLASWEES